MNDPNRARTQGRMPALMPLKLNTPACKKPCPTCGHPAEDHALTSRIVGCQHGDGTEESPTCYCSALYREAAGGGG